MTQIPFRTVGKHRGMNALRCWVTTVLLIGCLSAASAGEKPIGYAEFRLHCAVCHGLSGEGNGSISGLLNVKREALDLTRISLNNNSVYPYKRVFEIIDGRKNIAAHGESMMPIWGNRYSIEVGREYDSYLAKQVINGRILELVYYIQGIQRR